MIPPFRFGDAHIPQTFQHLFLQGLAPKAVADGDSLADLIADGFQRIQAGHGVLEHHGDLPAADLQPILFFFILGQILSIIKDLASRQ